MSWEPPFSTGTESAEPAGLRRLLRIKPARLMTPAIAVGVAAVLLMPDVKRAPRQDLRDHDSEPEMAMLPTPAPTLAMPAEDAPLASPFDGMATGPSLIPADQIITPAPSDRTIYSIYLYKLPGLAPDAPQGTILDIWVTWRPPLRPEPRVELLLRGVELQRIEDGFEQGPVADLLIRRKDVHLLIYGERFGSFNVTSTGP
jgi:hypothetical protein